MTSAAMAAFRYSCAPSSAAVRWCCPSPASRSPIMSRGCRRRGVTHISGTPSHWRKLLMSGSASGFSPRYVRLSGEIADQAVLDGLSGAFPAASIGHAYASTEAGVGFAVNDGREGFPAEMVGENRDGVEMKVEDGSLRIRSKRTAHAYVGRNAAAADRRRRLRRHRRHGRTARRPLSFRRPPRRHHQYRRPQGSSRGDRGGHQPACRRCGCRAPDRAAARSPAASWSPMSFWPMAATPAASDEIRARILADCRASLAPHKVPAVIKFVPSLDITAAGKLARHDA